MNLAPCIISLQGLPVHLEDVGIFKPFVCLDGRYRVRFCMNSSIRKQMNL